MAGIDLHSHTTASDGTLPPEEVVRLGRAAGLSALAVTDHDTVAAVPAALEAGARVGITVIPGVELSAQGPAGEVHILGYGMDLAAPPLEAALQWARQERENRNREMLARLRAVGVDLTWAQLRRAHPGTLGRPHFADALVRRGLCADVADAFARYLSPGRPCYVPRRYLPLSQAVDAIRASGGAAVLAHPLKYRGMAVEDLVAHCARAGIAGLECYYTGYSPAETERLLALAKAHGLIPTGGSDFHGDHKPAIRLGVGTGTLRVPETVLDGLNAAIRAQREENAR